MALFEPRATEDLKPPYAHFSQFRAFINAFQESATHSKDDVTRILHNLNDSARHNLRSTLRYLHLIYDDNTPTSSLVELINSGADRYRMVFRAILQTAYPFMFNGKGEAGVFDAFKATSEQLAEKFRAAGVTSDSTVERCVIFFRHAIKEAQMTEDRAGVTSIHQNGDLSSLLLPLPLLNEASRHERPESQYPPLPLYEANWPDDVKRLWFEILHHREIKLRQRE